MGRFLKRLSSLCLVLVLSISGLCNLITNAESEKISFKGLNERKIEDVIEYWKSKNYTAIECHFVSLLEEMGKVETARLYEDYKRQNQIDELLRNPERYIEFYDAEDLQIKLNDKIKSIACTFFNQFKFDPFNPQEVGLFTLIHNMNFAEVSDILFLTHFLGTEENKRILA